jgi:hypothetical protein
LEDTEEIDPQYQTTVTIYGREFQKYALDNNIHWAPIDEVRNGPERKHSQHLLL